MMVAAFGKARWNCMTRSSLVKSYVLAVSLVINDVPSVVHGPSASKQEANSWFAVIAAPVLSSAIRPAKPARLLPPRRPVSAFGYFCDASDRRITTRRRDEESRAPIHFPAVETNPIEEESPPLAGGVSDAQRLYGGYYYENYVDIPYERNDHWLEFFGMIANHIAIELQPRSVLDAGCAIGLLVETLRKRGIDVYGVDVSEYAISRADPSIREYVWQASLTEPLPRRYDLVTCIEVVEHIPSAEALTALDNICNATDRLLLSSSPVHFAEPTHINMKQPEDWSALGQPRVLPASRHGCVISRAMGRVVSTSIGPGTGAGSHVRAAAVATLERTARRTVNRALLAVTPRGGIPRSRSPAPPRTRS